MSMSSPAGSLQAPSFLVGIGASAGGLEALERLFKPMPLDTGMAFVVIQHLSPDFKSLMDELMARFTRLTVVRVSEPTEVRANCIYLLPPSKEMLIEHDRLVLVDRLFEQPVHLPISRFFRSLARVWGDRAVAIVLSGTGSDGSAGIVDVHEAGGLVIVQSEGTAKFDGMPRAAIAAGVADQVLAPEDIPACLVRYAINPSTLGEIEALTTDQAAPGNGPAALIERMREVHGIDFGQYKAATILRRMHRRMEFGHHPSLDAYCQRAISDPAELDEICHDLLIGVTRFFRDPEAFELLRERVIPDVVESVPPEEDVRVWVPGCATGEEAYSLAMLFLQELERRGRQANLRVFASDVHRDSLRIASDGVYTLDGLEALPVAMRDQYFVPEPDGRMRVVARVRKRVLFSSHNVLKDVPFNRIDLVSCRNLLIYFRPDAQTRALAAFYFSLKLRGTLVLGPSETLGELDDYFTPIDRTWKVYQKSSDKHLPLDVKLRPSEMLSPPPRATSQSDVRLLRAYDVLLEQYMPAGILLNERREQLHVFGDGGKFLRLPTGRATLDVVAMCDGDLRVAVSAGLSGAAKRREKVVVRGVRVGRHPPTLVDVSVEPLDDSTTGARHYLLRFIEPLDHTGPSLSTASPIELSDDARARIQQLEAELRESRESFQAMLEEFEATNEELQASNEELIASNEELQSTNEELQSVNEELYSVNAEHNQRIRDLAAATSDMRNLISASHAGIIFTDDCQNVRLFTPGAARILNLMPQDVGRPLAHITSRIQGDDVLEGLQRVQQFRQPVEKSLLGPDGRYYLRRIQTYEDADRLPAGFVISFTDITERKRAESAEHERLELVKVVIDASPSQIAVVNRKGVIVATNRAWDAFGVENGGPSGATLLGKSYFDLGPRQPSEPSSDEAMALLADVLEGRSKRADLDYPCHSATEDRWFWMNITAMPPEQGGAVITHTDISARKKAEAIEIKLQETARLESLGILAGGIAHDFNNILTGIMANVSLLRTELAEGSAQGEPLAEVQQAAVRASELCKQMLAFSGRGRFVLSRLRLPTLVNETASLVRASMTKNTRLELALDADGPMVEVDVAQIQQVVMNLAINASEALPPEGGVVCIETRVEHPVAQNDEIEIVGAANPELPHVALEVRDDGCGIERDLLKRIFEPFYTNKFTGRGLGLAAVQGIIRGHRGALFVRSSPGQGTSFRMLLPVATSESHTDERPSQVTPAPEPKGRAILVVDDEEVVRKSLSRILVRKGYQCVLAASGAEAIERFSEAPDLFSMVILDLTMPPPDGVATFRELRRLSASVRVLLTSGYSESDATGRFQGVGPAGFLQKPISVATLLESVHAVLGAPAPLC